SLSVSREETLSVHRPPDNARLTGRTPFAAYGTELTCNTAKVVNLEKISGSMGTISGSSIYRRRTESVLTELPVVNRRSFSQVIRSSTTGQQPSFPPEVPQDTHIMSATDSGHTLTVFEEHISSHSIVTAPEQDLLHVPATSRTTRTIETSVVDTIIPPPVSARSAVRKRAGRTEQKNIYKPPDRRHAVIRTASRVLERRPSNLLQYRLDPEIGRKFVYSTLPATHMVNDAYPTVSVHVPEINKRRITPHLVQPTAQMRFMEPARRPHSVSRMQYVADNVRTSHSLPSHSSCYDDAVTAPSVLPGEAISRSRKVSSVDVLYGARQVPLASSVSLGICRNCSERAESFAWDGASFDGLPLCSTGKNLDCVSPSDAPEHFGGRGPRSLHRRFTDPILTLPCFRPTVDICPHNNEYELLKSPTQRPHTSLLTTTYQAEYNGAQWEQARTNFTTVKSVSSPVTVRYLYQPLYASDTPQTPKESQCGELVSPIQPRTMNAMCSQTEQPLHHNLDTVQLSRWRSQLNPPPRCQIARAMCVPYVRQFRIPPPPIFMHTITSVEDPVQACVQTVPRDSDSNTCVLHDAIYYPPVIPASDGTFIVSVSPEMPFPDVPKRPLYPHHPPATGFGYTQLSSQPTFDNTAVGRVSTTYRDEYGDPGKLANPIIGTRHDGYTGFYVPFSSVPVKENQERLRASKNHTATVPPAVTPNYPSKSMKKSAEIEKEYIPRSGRSSPVMQTAVSGLQTVPVSSQKLVKSHTKKEGTTVSTLSGHLLQKSKSTPSFISGTHCSSSDTLANTADYSEWSTSQPKVSFHKSVEGYATENQRPRAYSCVTRESVVLGISPTDIHLPRGSNMKARKVSTRVSVVKSLSPESSTTTSHFDKDRKSRSISPRKVKTKDISRRATRKPSESRGNRTPIVFRPGQPLPQRSRKSMAKVSSKLQCGLRAKQTEKTRTASDHGCCAMCNPPQFITFSYCGCSSVAGSPIPIAISPCPCYWHLPVPKTTQSPMMVGSPKPSLPSKATESPHTSTDSMDLSEKLPSPSPLTETSFFAKNHRPLLEQRSPPSSASGNLSTPTDHVVRLFTSCINHHFAISTLREGDFFVAQSVRFLL
ncbi:hypothetical protein P879_05486, partial [Paragonimus westermani]